VAAACPLCGGAALPFACVHSRDYFSCDGCGLAFVAPWQRPEPAAERARYDTHRNDPADPGYRAFLGRLAEPLAARLPPGATGLDYGSGPGPALSLMLEERGFRMRIFDPFYAPDPAPLLRTYDFITCTEVAEHFFDPATEFARLHDLLRPGGWLGVMTLLLDGDIDFAAWWYVRDPTHVCFYRPRTMQWLADRHGWSYEPLPQGVSLFRRGAAGRTSAPA
jgi:SAM-dependent methyltransferase